jgi:protein TonB
VKDRKSWLLPAGIFVSLLLHAALFRLFHTPAEIPERPVERIGVTLRRKSPATEKPAVQPREIEPLPEQEPKDPLEPVEPPPEKPEIADKPEKHEADEEPEVPDEIPPEPSGAREEEPLQAETEFRARGDFHSPAVEEPSPGTQPDESSRVDDAVRQFVNLLREKKVYPYVARKKGLQGTVLLLVRLSPRGELLEASVLRSSGHTVLDKAALSLVKRAVPFSHETGRVLAMEVPVKYSLID